MSLFRTRKTKSEDPQDDVPMEIVGLSVSETKAKQARTGKTPRLFKKKRWEDWEISDAIADAHRSSDQEFRSKLYKDLAESIADLVASEILGRMKNLDEKDQKVLE